MEELQLRFHKNLYLRYKAVGKGNPLILLHGWGQSAGMWDNIQRECSRFATVYVLDLPGFGSSDTPPYKYSISDYAHVLQLLIDKNHLKDVTIIAHSFSGKPVLYYANKNPEKVSKIILIGTLAFSTGWYRLIPFYLCKYLHLPQLFYWASSNLFHPRSYFNKTATTYNKAKIMLDTYLKIRSQDASFVSDKTARKLILIHGVKDKIVPLKYSLRFVRQLGGKPKMYSIDNTGHFPHIDSKRYFLNILKKELSEIRNSAVQKMRYIGYTSNVE